MVFLYDVLAAVHKSDLFEEDCNDIQAKIDLAMSHLRRIDMSVTPKGHRVDGHVVR